MIEQKYNSKELETVGNLIKVIGHFVKDTVLGYDNKFESAASEYKLLGSTKKQVLRKVKGIEKHVDQDIYKTDEPLIVPVKMTLEAYTTKKEKAENALKKKKPAKTDKVVKPRKEEISAVEYMADDQVTKMIEVTYRCMRSKFLSVIPKDLKVFWIFLVNKFTQEINEIVAKNREESDVLGLIERNGGFTKFVMDYGAKANMSIFSTDNCFGEHTTKIITGAYHPSLNDFKRIISSRVNLGLKATEDIADGFNKFCTRFLTSLYIIRTQNDKFMVDIKAYFGALIGAHLECAGKFNVTDLIQSIKEEIRIHCAVLKKGTTKPGANVIASDNPTFLGAPQESDDNNELDI